MGGFGGVGVCRCRCVRICTYEVTICDFFETDCSPIYGDAYGAFKGAFNFYVDRNVDGDAPAGVPNLLGVQMVGQWQDSI